MSAPTYRDLFNVLKSIPEDRLDDNVTIYDSAEDEYHPASSINITTEDDVLDKGHVYISIQD
jgi:hypothetical protein